MIAIHFSPIETLYDPKRISHISFIRIPFTSLSSIPRYLIVTAGEEWLNLLHKISHPTPNSFLWMYPKVFLKV